MTRRSNSILHFFLILIAFFISYPVLAQEERVVSTYEDEDAILDEAHVRGFVWGLPSFVVKEQEEGIFVEEDKDGTLFFVDTIRGIKSSLSYYFVDNKLSRVQIFSEKRYPRPQERVDDMIAIKNNLDKRFGEPIEENFQWKKDTDKAYPDQWGWAVYGGELIITITWEDEETFVTAYLGAPDPFRPILVVTYEDAKAKKRKADKKREDTIRIVP